MNVEKSKIYLLRNLFLTVGIVPASFVFTQIGAGLLKVAESHRNISLQILLNPQIKIALFGLAILALIPILIKKFTKIGNS